MPTVKQALDYYKEQVRKGKGHLHTGHCFIAEEEEKKRIEGSPDAEGKPKTKISWDSADADSYREWHRERKRWMAACHGNPTLATDSMIVALKAYSEEAMSVVIETLNEQRIQKIKAGPYPKPPEANIPF